MAIPKVKATYSLDELTVRKLGEIARKWNTSKSEALARLINDGAESTPEDEVARKLAALDRYVTSVRSRLTPQQIEEWQRETREIHRDAGFRVDQD